MTRIRLPFIHEYRDRHGKLRRYFRKPGCKRVALSGEAGSEEFMTAYHAALAGASVVAPIGASKTRPGTVNAAVIGYRQSLAFRELSPGTQAVYRSVLERFRDEHGDKRIGKLPQNFIVHMLSRMRPGAKRNWLKALRALLEFAVAEGFRSDNPARGIKLGRRKTKSHRPWSEDEMARYEAAHPVGTKARLAFALLRFTAQRRGDVLRIGPQHIRNGELCITQEKSGNEVSVPITPELQTVLDATPCQHLTFLTTLAGKPYHRSSFNKEFRKWCDAAELPKDCVPHGLRHTRGHEIANEGGTAFHVAAILGHKTLSEVQRYTKGADRARLAREATDLLTKKGNARWLTLTEG